MTVKSRILVVLIALWAVFAMLTFGANGSADAAPMLPGQDCLDPPVPASPLSGPANGIDAGPVKPLPGDPFASDTATMYDRYGYAGLGINKFEQPTIGPELVGICQPLNLDMSQHTANVWVDAAAVVTAVTVRFTRLVTDGGIGAVWDPVQQGLLRTTGGRLFLSGVVLTMLAGIAYAAVVWASKGQVRLIAGWLGRAFVIVWVGMLCTFYAVGVGAAMDKGIGEGFKSAGEIATETTAREPADMVGGLMVDKVLYPMWERQMFGGDQKAAAEFGPRLWRAGTFTREEQAGIAANPGSAQALVDTRREQYKTAMAELKTKYPQTYNLTSGQDSSTQMWEALVGLTGVAAGAWFLIACLARILWGMIVVRVAVGLFPAVAVAAVLPKFHTLAMRVGSMVVKAGWRALLSAFAFFAFVVAVLAPIMSSDREPLVRAAAVTLAAVAMHVLLRIAGGAPARLAQGRLDRSKRATANSGSQESSTETLDPVREAGNPVAGTSLRTYRAPHKRPKAETVDLGSLKSVSTPQPARPRGGGATTKAAVAAAGRVHPAAGVAAAAVTSNRGRSQSSRSGNAGAPPPRRVITGKVVTRRTEAKAVNRAPQRRRPWTVTRDGVVTTQPTSYTSAVQKGQRPPQRKQKPPIPVGSQPGSAVAVRGQATRPPQVRK